MKNEGKNRNRSRTYFTTHGGNHFTSRINSAPPPPPPSKSMLSLKSIFFWLGVTFGVENWNPFLKPFSLKFTFYKFIFHMRQRKLTLIMKFSDRIYACGPWDEDAGKKCAHYHCFIAYARASHSGYQTCHDDPNFGGLIAISLHHQFDAHFVLLPSKYGQNISYIFRFVILCLQNAYRVAENCKRSK